MHQENTLNAEMHEEQVMDSHILEIPHKDNPELDPTFDIEAILTENKTLEKIRVVIKIRDLLKAV